MTQRVEWRTRGETNDVVLVVDDDQNTVRQALEADPGMLTDFLNDMASLDTWRERPSVKAGQGNPDTWGDLVMARAPTGEIITMDPELYWDGIYNWFRSRGVDPHSAHR